MRKFWMGLTAVGLVIVSGAALAGLWQGLPLIGAGAICWGTTSTATGTLIGIQTGCPTTAPAGPTVTSGGELIPADRYKLTGTGQTQVIGSVNDNPSTVYLSLASLGALPLSFENIGATAPFISASNVMGGIMFNSAATITTANITLPLTPQDGQQFTVGSNRTITTLVVSGANVSSPIGSNTAPTVLTASTSVPQNYKFVFSGLLGIWLRLY